MTFTTRQTTFPNSLSRNLNVIEQTGLFPGLLRVNRDIIKVKLSNGIICLAIVNETSSACKINGLDQKEPSPVGHKQTRIISQNHFYKKCSVINT